MKSYHDRYIFHEKPEMITNIILTEPIPEITKIKKVKVPKSKAEKLQTQSESEKVSNLFIKDCTVVMNRFIKIGGRKSGKSGN